MPEQDPQEQPERNIAEMSERTERLEGDIEEARRDWESKKSDESVPGAPPDDEEEHEGPDPESPERSRT